MGNRRNLALSIASALFLTSLGLAFVPAAAAHECRGEPEYCGPCPDGENHHHVDEAEWWWEDESECTSYQFPPPPPPPPPAPRCSNGADDDGDGKVDDADPGCTSSRDDSEQDPEEPEPSFCEANGLPQIVCDLKDWLLGDGGSNPITQVELPN